MGLIDKVTKSHINFVPYANIIYDHERRKAQDIILAFLATYGLLREPDDLEPMTDWQNAYHFVRQPLLALAGRFGQWKYFWSDDCIIRGMQLSQAVLNFK